MDGYTVVRAGGEPPAPRPDGRNEIRPGKRQRDGEAEEGRFRIERSTVERWEVFPADVHDEGGGGAEAVEKSARKPEDQESHRGGGAGMELGEVWV